MIKKGIDLSYKVDPYGTEEIISSAANSCAPILTIDYGDEVQTDAEFTIRPTKGSLDTNISDVASINPIKGNTVAWNQKIDSTRLISESSFTNNDVVYTKNADGTITANGLANGGRSQCPIYEDNLSRGFRGVYGHKYFFYRSVCDSDVLVAFIGNDGWTTSGVGSNLKFISTCINQDKGAGILCRVAEGTSVSNLKFFCIAIDLTIIYGAGNEPSTVAAFEADYYKWFGKQLTYEPYSAGELRPVKMNGIKTTGANNSWVSVNPIPVTTLTGKLNGQGSSVVVFSDGMKKAGSVYDEIVKVNGVWKAIKRVGSVDLGSINWGVGLFNNYMRAGSSQLPVAGKQVSYCFSNQINGGGYISNLAPISDNSINMAMAYYNNQIFIRDDAYTNATGDEFKVAMSGVMLYYELNTIEEYILDAFDVQKMMLGANEVHKVYLGSNVVFQNQS